MDLWRRLVRNINNNKGSATILLSLMIAIIVIVLCFFITEYFYIETMYKQAENALVAAGLAALATPNSVDIAYGQYVLDKSYSEAIFREKIAENLRLDSNLNPMENSIAITPVIIEEFNIYNPEEITVGLECPLGTPITKTSIHAVISFKIKRPILSGLLGEDIPMRVHKDVANTYDLININ